MKKLLSTLLSIVLILAMCNTAFAATPQSSTTEVQASREYLAELYDIPTDVVNTLSPTIISRLSQKANGAQSISSNDTYIKVTYNKDGSSTSRIATYQEYLSESSLRDTDENSWMRIHTTIVDKGSHATVSAAYTWLTRPAFRMRDVIGLSLTQGTFMDNTADGFYTYTTSQGSFTTDFSDTPGEFSYQGHGIVRNVTLSKPNNPVATDYLFLSADIHKEANSEGLNGTYGHQRASISIVPSFTIDRTGWLSCVGLNVGMTYDQFSGYTDTKW